MKLFFTIFAAILAAAAVIWGAVMLKQNGDRRRADIAAAYEKLHKMDSQIDQWSDLASNGSDNTREMAKQGLELIGTEIELYNRRFPYENDLRDRGRLLKIHLKVALDALQK